MARIIMCGSFKGGVGKTASSWNLAYSLARWEKGFICAGKEYRGIRMLKKWNGKSIGEGDAKASNLDMFSLEMFENIAYVMAKHADPSIPDNPEEWLDEFNTFSIYQVLPKLIELWGMNIRTDVEAKKNFMQQTVK